MRRTCITVLAAMIMLIPMGSPCQDIQFSQYYNASPLMNPAFAGTSYAYRAIANVRRQWNGLDANYNSYFAAIDYNASSISSGLGFFMLHDEQGDGTVLRNEVAAQYVYALQLPKESALRLALQGSYNQRRVRRDLTFPDQFTGGGFDPSSPSADLLNAAPQVYADVSAGILYYNERIWLGASAFHLNRPDHSLLSLGERLDRSYYFIAGYKHVISRRSQNRFVGDPEMNELSITPTFQYKMQSKSDQLDVGLYAMYSHIMLGVWYRGIPMKKAEGVLVNNESVIFLAGLRLDQFSVGYSYDKVISPLGLGAEGAHELNIVYHWPRLAQRKKPLKFLPCPSFIPVEKPARKK